MRRRVRNKRGSLAEFAPTLTIAFFALFGLIGLAFLFAGVATANYACQLAVREGATGGSRTACRTAAINAARAVATGPFGAFVNLQAADGGDFANGLDIQFLMVQADGTTVNAPAADAIDPTQTYQIRIVAPYRVTVPFVSFFTGANMLPTTAASECYIDKPESLAVP